MDLNKDNSLKLFDRLHPDNSTHVNSDLLKNCNYKETSVEYFMKLGSKYADIEKILIKEDNHKVEKVEEVNMAKLNVYTKQNENL